MQLWSQKLAQLELGIIMLVLISRNTMMMVFPLHLSILTALKVITIASTGSTLTPICKVGVTSLARKGLRDTYSLTRQYSIICPITGASAHACSQLMPSLPSVNTTTHKLLSNQMLAPLPWRRYLERSEISLNS